MGMQASSMAKYVSMQGLEENRGAREEGLWQKPLRFESDRPSPIYKLEARPQPNNKHPTSLHTSSRSFFASPTYLTTLNTASILNKTNATKQNTYPSPQSSTKRTQQTSQHTT